jgi:hypothetical protein
LLSNGDGTFQAPINYYINNGYAGITAIQLADFNLDGKLDVVGEFFYGSGLRILAGNGDGSVYELGCVCGPGYPNGLAVADFNKDGLPDAAFGLYAEQYAWRELEHRRRYARAAGGGPHTLSPITFVLLRAASGPLDELQAAASRMAVGKQELFLIVAEIGHGPQYRR